MVFFAAGRHYAASVRLQTSSGGFVEELPVRSEITGPVDPYRRGDGARFLTLDKGKNRVRELRLKLGGDPPPPVPGEIPVSVLAVPVGPGAAAGPGVKLGDCLPIDKSAAKSAVSTAP